MTDKAMIDEIMDNFDFKKVKQTMDLLDWKWYNGDYGDLRIPSLEEIKDFARYLMEETIKKDTTSIASGGFRVERMDEGLNLMFIITEYMAFDETEEGEDD